VPFVVQAPFGEWADSRQQDACEEASVLMVKCWVDAGGCRFEDEQLDKKWAKDELMKMYDWEVKNYGSGTDTSASDTAEREIFTIFKYKFFTIHLNEPPVNARGNNKVFFK
jgi:hypothetical protein